MANHLILHFGLVCWDLLFEKQPQNHHYGELGLDLLTLNFSVRCQYFGGSRGRKGERGRSSVPQSHAQGLFQVILWLCKAVLGDGEDQVNDHWRLRFCIQEMLDYLKENRCDKLVLCKSSSVNSLKNKFCVVVYLHTNFTFYIKLLTFSSFDLIRYTQ